MRIYFFPAGAEIEKRLHPAQPATFEFLRQLLTSFELKLNLMKLYDPGCNELCRSQVAKVQNMNEKTFNRTLSVRIPATKSETAKSPPGSARFGIVISQQFYFLNSANVRARSTF